MAGEALVKAAIASICRAYAPYSKFPVGATILDQVGAIHVGANMENAANPVGNCAEASAITAMLIAGQKRIVKIAVAGGNGDCCALRAVPAVNASANSRQPTRLY